MRQWSHWRKWSLINIYQFDLSLNRYASRVKLITNDAQKNADNKEISKLKAVSHILYTTWLYLLILFFIQIIAKLKRGEEVDDEE